MSDINDVEVSRAEREYVQALGEYHQLLNKYIPIKEVVPGLPGTTGEMLNEEALKELGEAEDKIHRARKRWRGLTEI